MVAVQRTSSDLKLNPHVHAVFLDGVYRDKKEDGEELEFRALAHLTTRDVATVLERTRDRMTKYLLAEVLSTPTATTRRRTTRASAPA